MINLGKLKEIKDLRKVWPHEALDFTPWLAEEDNLTLLADAVGLEITVDETESSVGDFNVDIYATETGTDRKIIIENQLEDTNHDHLGKLITYASGKSADIVIWVVKRAREEHRSAIEWLNNHTDENIAFFLVEIKLYQIGSSDIAVKFEVVEKPNDWTKEIKRNTSNSPTLQARYDYWVAFNDYAFQNNAFAKQFNKRKASTDHWMTFSVGSSACHISMSQIRNTTTLLWNGIFPMTRNCIISSIPTRMLLNRRWVCSLSGINFQRKKQAVSWCIRRSISIIRIHGLNSLSG